ncbi:hypothetical protein F2P56_015294 [Juglans regia]|uniref:Uncharacterized protein n=2 Tax=Juglans regia TaxID=51240 RepID=A0A833XEM6_JUGRE|nr:uncharacterized protein LOC108991101 isoform X2 [Juglans regia]KAF5465272.1 hypothetical protein F2P56_015294 [Juglans regia]
MLYTTRVAWILKHHSDLSHATWHDVPTNEKDELVARVQVDFILDWTKKNHRLTVMKTFRKRFNAIRYELHKIYKTFENAEEALANRPSWVNPNVWVKLCGRWSSEEFKSDTDSHLVDFFKDVRWSKKKGKFVTPLIEENYNEMARKLAKLEPKKHTKEAATTIFEEVLSHRSGYVRGLGEMVIPDSSRGCNDEVITELTTVAARHQEDVARHEKDAQYYKSQLDELRGDVKVLLERQREYDKLMTTLMSESSLKESLIERLKELHNLLLRTTRAHFLNILASKSDQGDDKPSTIF